MKISDLFFSKTILLYYYAFLCVLTNVTAVAMDEVINREQLPPMHHRSDLIMSETLTTPTSLRFEQLENKTQKVVCNTCHDIDDIENKDVQTIDKKQDNFLRNGPYEKLTDFCYLCHKKKQNSRDNIHILLESSLDKEGKKQKKEQQCLYCHTEVLKQATLEKTEQQQYDSKLRLPADKICYGCHLKTPHLNALEHQVEVKDDMLTYLKKTRQLYEVNLPLGEKNRINCVTCHDPHQQGVLKQKNRQAHVEVSADLIKGVSYKRHPWAVTYNEDKKQRLQTYEQNNKQQFKAPLKQQTDRSMVLNYQRINNEVLLRLPAKNGKLCIACHDFSQERLW